MKKELKDMIFVGVITFLFVAAVGVAYALISLNIGGGAKKISINIYYSERSYEYGNIKTDKNDLSAVLREYNEKLALGFAEEENGQDIFINSLKSTARSLGGTYSYRIEINGEEVSLSLDKIRISDGDKISIRYVHSVGNKTSLAEGGDSNFTYYQKMSIAFGGLSAVILLLSLLYIAFALVNYHKNKKIISLESKK